jgi:hypothetical protein
VDVDQRQHEIKQHHDRSGVDEDLHDPEEVGILHGCLKTHTPYDEAVAWNQHTQQAAA